VAQATESCQRDACTAVRDSRAHGVRAASVISRVWLLRLAGRGTPANMERDAPRRKRLLLAEKGSVDPNQRFLLPGLQPLVELDGLLDAERCIALILVDEA